MWLEPIQEAWTDKPKCDEEAGRGRRMGAEKIIRHSVGQMKTSVEDATEKARRSTDCITARVGRRSET